MKRQRIRSAIEITFAAVIAIHTPAFAAETPVFGLTPSPLQRSAQYNDSDLSQTQAAASFQPASSSPLPWQDFTSEAGQFAILMPSPPVGLAYPSEQFPLDPADPINQFLEAGQVFFQTRLDEQGRIAIYAAGFAEFDQSIDAVEATQQIVNSFTSSLKPNDRLNQQTIALGNYPGLEIEIQAADGTLSVARCYTAGQRGYFIITAALPFSLTGNSDNTSIVRSQSIDVFLNSFRLLSDTNF